MRGKTIITWGFFLLSNFMWAQADTTSKKLSFHFQQTIVYQYQPGVAATYSGTNSLSPKKEHAASLTSTFFIGYRLWKGAKIFYNPEIAGGSGLSLARGVAAFPNGETFRIGNPAPQVYTARLFLEQKIATGTGNEMENDDANQIAGIEPTEYWHVVAGKFSLADYFDNNQYSHDPRSQFLNWGLMSTGAWDYAANTRGYTYGVLLQRVKTNWAIRYAASLVPKVANGPNLNWDFKKYSAHQLEFERDFQKNGKGLKLRLLAFYNIANMASYKQTYTNRDTSLDVSLVRNGPRTKMGVSINAEYTLTENAGIFFRSSYNDGNNETWAFTEIDQSISIGYFQTGKRFMRPMDKMGIATLVSGISSPHRQYLRKGGYGFMIGDGTLTYAPEFVTELFYSIHLHEDHFWFTPDFQFVLNPGYNSDRGPAYIFGARMHAEF